MKNSMSSIEEKFSVLMSLSSMFCPPLQESQHWQKPSESTDEHLRHKGCDDAVDTRSRRIGI